MSPAPSSRPQFRHPTVGPATTTGCRSARSVRRPRRDQSAAGRTETATDHPMAPRLRATWHSRIRRSRSSGPAPWTPTPPAARRLWCPRFPLDSVFADPEPTPSNRSVPSPKDRTACSRGCLRLEGGFGYCRRLSLKPARSGNPVSWVRPSRRREAGATPVPGPPQTR